MVAATAQAQCLKENEITEQDSLLLTRNLLRIAIFNITYIRGLFPESYFNDKSVPALEMKIKKLMPMDAESRRLIDWMEKGVYDALQKKYLRTLFFCISETETGPLIEEYAFSFSYCSDSSEISMNVNKSGGNRQGTTFKSKSVDFSPNYIRSCACKMVRTLVQLMRTLDQMPEERTIIMKLCYYDEVTPSDYEPPFFRCYGEEENQEWSRPPLKMKVGGVDSKHFMIALKVKSVLDPCEDENENIYEDIQETSNGEYSEQPGNEASETTLSETQEMKEDEQADNEITEIESGKDLARSHQNTKIEEEVNKEQKEQDKNLETVKEWLRCRHMDTVDVTDILSEFPEIPMEVIDDLIDRLVKQDLLQALRKDKYVIRVGGQEAMPTNVNDKFQTNGVISRPENKDGDQDLLYAKALYHVLPMDYVTVGKLQNKFDDQVNQSVVRKLLEKMSLDGYIESRATGNRRQGRRVIRSERARLKLKELQRRLHGEHQEKEERSPEKSKNPGTSAIDKDTSTNGRLHSLGSDLTRHGQSPQSGSKPHDFKKPASPAGPRCGMAKPAASRESTVKYGRPGSNAEAKMEMEEVRCSQSTCDNWEKRSRKTSMVKEPIYQCAKRLKSSQNPDFVD